MPTIFSGDFNEFPPVSKVTPLLKKGKDILACRGDTVLLETQATNYTDTVFWKWFFEGNQISNDPKVKVVKPGLYSLIISDSNQCLGNIDTIEVSNIPGKANAGPDLINCKDEAFIFKNRQMQENEKANYGNQ